MKHVDYSNSIIAGIPQFWPSQLLVHP